MKVEFGSQTREMLFFLTILDDMPAVTSRANQQFCLLWEHINQMIAIKNENTQLHAVV